MSTDHRVNVMDVSLIFGASGQDGAYLARELLVRGHKVFCCVRPTSSLDNLVALDIRDQVETLDFELSEPDSIKQAIAASKASHVFNLAASGFVAASFDDPFHPVKVDAAAIVTILEAQRRSIRPFRFVHASSSEMFGGHQAVHVGRETAVKPSSPYGAAKAYCHHMVQLYRNAYNVHAVSAILFNHESPLRPDRYVTRKITKGLAEFFFQEGPPIRLGNLDGRRDWSFAGDIAQGLVLMGLADTPSDYVLASGSLHSVRDFVRQGVAWWGREIEWHGSGCDEIGVLVGTDRIVVEVDQAFYRPVDPAALCGDPSDAIAHLGWTPTLSFQELVWEMISEDWKRMSPDCMPQVQPIRELGK